MRKTEEKPNQGEAHFRTTEEDKGGGMETKGFTDLPEMRVSSNSSLNSSVSRRGFLKAGALSAAALSAAGAMTGCSSWLGATKQTAAEERVAYAVHQTHCHGDCSLKCTVRDNRICLIEPNDAYKGTRYATVCLKGISEIQHIYSADRIQTPMKLVGERGSGEFESITWDEAFSILEERLGDIRSKYGKQSIFIGYATESRMDYLPKVFQCTASPGDGYDIGVANGLDPAIGFGNGFGFAPNCTRDWAYAKTLLIVGTNFLESALAQSRTFFDAKDAGCHIICVDTNYSTTACKADEWVPIKPATDAALFLGMITKIIDEGWYDENFMKANTVFPCLINKKTGAYLTEKSTDESGTVTTYFYVVDEKSGDVVRMGETSAPKLDTTITVDGVEYATVFTLLKENQKQYTVSWASKVSTVPEETIASIAQQYSCNKPASFALGWNGNDKFGNADVSGHAAAILAALTGNSGKVGAGVGVYTRGSSWRREISLASWPLDSQYSFKRTKRAYYMMQQNDIHAAITLGDNIAQAFANANETNNWLKRLDFVVYCDIYAGSTAAYSDLILPVCTKFESEDEVGRMRQSYDHLALEQKVLDPLFESKSDFSLEHFLCKAIGLEDVLPPSMSELAQYQLDALKKKTGWEDITMEKLKANKYTWPVPGSEEPRRALLNQVYKTASTKMHVYYDSMYADGQALPNWEEPDEIYDSNPLREKYPLQMYALHTRYHVHNQFWDATWIQQFNEPAFEMNPADMETRGLKTGDVVEVFNDRGSFKTYVRENPSLRPGSTNIYEGAPAKYMIEGTFQMVTNNHMNARSESLMSGGVIPFHDTLVEVKKSGE